VGLGEDDKRTQARTLNLARRQLTNGQKRQLIADQLTEPPGRSNRWDAKALGESHPPVASVWVELEAGGKVLQRDSRIGTDGKSYRPAKRRRP
jgi:hypothetical protein